MELSDIVKIEVPFPNSPLLLEMMGILVAVAVIRFFARMWDLIGV